MVKSWCDRTYIRLSRSVAEIDQHAAFRLSKQQQHLTSLLALFLALPFSLTYSLISLSLSVSLSLSLSASLSVCLSVCLSVSLLSLSVSPSLSLSLSLSLSPLPPPLSHTHSAPRWPSGKASSSRAEDPGFESHLRRDFFGVESYQ